MAQLDYRPTWLDEARRLQAEEFEAADHLKQQTLLQLEENVSAFDAIDGLDDHDLAQLVRLCGGSTTPLSADDAVDHSRQLGLRLGRLFSGDAVRDAVETVLKIQHSVSRDPTDSSHTTVRAGELVEYLQERRHSKQQLADKIRRSTFPVSLTTSSNSLLVAAGAPAAEEAATEVRN